MLMKTMYSYILIYALKIHRAAFFVHHYIYCSSDSKTEIPLLPADVTLMSA